MPSEWGHGYRLSGELHQCVTGTAGDAQVLQLQRLAADLR